MRDSKKLIYLVRGISGAGKSTFTNSLGLKNIEADMFFIDPVTGEYNFDGSKIKQAHIWCQECVESVMISGESVVVSNTFTQEWEMEHYYELAKKYGYMVFSVIVENRHNGVNQHNVPDDIIDKMKNRFQIKL